MITRIAVIIPAANEEEAIARCLTSVRVAAALVTCALRVVVVLDGCADGTAAQVASFPEVGTFVTSARNVGQARRLGTQHVLLGDDNPEELWLANTDADSQVPANWLVRTLQLAARADLVLGTVVPDSGLNPAIERVWFDQHQLRDGHPYIHAANLGIRASAYLALGGWNPLPTGEDADLADRAVAADLRVHRTADIAVRTSTRVIGRAPQGFSSYLRALGHA